MTVNDWWRDRTEAEMTARRGQQMVHWRMPVSDTHLTPAPAYLSKVPRDLVALLSSRFGFEFAL